MNIFSSLKQMFGNDTKIRKTSMEVKTSDRYSPNFNDIHVNSPYHKAPFHDKQNIMQYGYIRTLVDLIKCLNEKNHYHNHQVLISDLNKVISSYIRRGTISPSLVHSFEELLYQNSQQIFKSEGLDIDELVVMQHFMNPSSQYNNCDEIFMNFDISKLLKILQSANHIRQYQSPSEVLFDIEAFIHGFGGGWKVPLLGACHPHLHAGIRYFINNLESIWDSISKDANINGKRYLDNTLLEAYVFSKHENDVKIKGLERTLKEDYHTEATCHSTMYMPNEINSAPIYATNRYYKKPIRTCYPTGDALEQQTMFESGFFQIIFNDEIRKGNYEQRNFYYIPVKDLSKPIYNQWFKEVKFDSGSEKRKFIDDCRRYASC